MYKNANGTTNRALFRGLYQGVGSIILITIPSSGAFFTTYEALKYTINDAVPPNSTLYLPQPAVHAVSSAGAELVSCAILTPAEVLKQNAQVVVRDPNQKKSSPTWEMLKQFRRHPTQLWRGYTALAGRNLPFTGLQFPAFEHLKGFFLERRQRQKGGPADGVAERAAITAMSAAIAGCAAAWITTPIDVVKTRIMLAAGDDTAQSAIAEQAKNLTPEMQRAARKSGWLVAREVFRNEGIKGLFRGGLLRAGWTAFGSGLYLGCYESGRHYLEDQRVKSNKHEGDNLMQKDLKNIKIGIGRSRSQDVVKKSAWQED